MVVVAVSKINPAAAARACGSAPPRRQPGWTPGPGKAGSGTPGASLLPGCSPDPAGVTRAEAIFRLEQDGSWGKKTPCLGVPVSPAHTARGHPLPQRRGWAGRQGPAPEQDKPPRSHCGLQRPRAALQALPNRHGPGPQHTPPAGLWAGLDVSYAPSRGQPPRRTQEIRGPGPPSPGHSSAPAWCRVWWCSRLARRLRRALVCSARPTPSVPPHVGPQDPL